MYHFDVRSDPANNPSCGGQAETDQHIPVEVIELETKYRFGDGDLLSPRR